MTRNPTVPQQHQAQVGGWASAWIWWCSCGTGGVHEPYPTEAAAASAARTHLARTVHRHQHPPTSLTR
jgi:hypothetical protein